jgi:hypothetical protein
VSPLLTSLAPPAVGFMFALLGWLLLAARTGPGATPQKKACVNCGSSVLDEWRLCPECGILIGSTDPGAEAGPSITSGTDSDSGLSF